MMRVESCHPEKKLLLLRLAWAAALAPALWLVFRRLDIPAFGRLLMGVNPALLAAAFLCMILANAVKSLKIGFLLGQSRCVSFPVLFAAEMVSAMVDTVFSLRMREATKAMLIKRATGLSAGFTLGAQVVERSVDIVVFGCLLAALGFPALLPRDFLLSLNIPVWGGIAIAAGVFVMIAFAAVWKWCRASGHPWATALEAFAARLVEGFKLAATRPRGLAAAVALTCAEWALTIGVILLTALAMRLEPGLDSVVLVLGAGALAFAVPNAIPASAGVYHLLVAGALTKIGRWPWEPAMAWALTMHAVVVITAAASALVSLRILRRARSFP